MKNKTWLVYGFLFLVCCQWPFRAAAEEAPKWEAGLGVFAFQFPAYRGAVESSKEVVPAPYYVYRGEYFKADRDGVRGVLVETDLFELNVSVAASPPIASNSVKARYNMPDLPASLELGPSVDIKLWQSASQDVKLKLFIPVRAAMTVESGSKFVGWQFTPRLNLDVDNPMGLQGWTLGSVAGPVFGSREQHSYFYGVAPQFGTLDRPAFEARGGYAGLQLLSALWKRFPSFWVGGFVRYDTVQGAVFESSPLVTQRSGFSGGLAISWILGQSSEMVPVD